VNIRAGYALGYLRKASLLHPRVLSGEAVLRLSVQVLNLP
jgi:hypothetical protein